jgi:hypothetical protein
VKAVQTQIDAIARGDLTAGLAHAHPKVELEIFAPPEFEWVRHARGIEAMRVANIHKFWFARQQTSTAQNVITQADTQVLYSVTSVGSSAPTAHPTTCSSCSDSPSRKGGFVR